MFLVFLFPQILLSVHLRCLLTYNECVAAVQRLYIKRYTNVVSCNNKECFISFGLTSLLIIIYCDTVEHTASRYSVLVLV